MSEERILEIQQGIWIDEEWLRSAGLGDHLQVVVKPGEIRILSLPAENETQTPDTSGWDVFRSLGREALPGSLFNASVEHDRYLYRKKQ